MNRSSVSILLFISIYMLLAITASAQEFRGFSLSKIISDPRTFESCPIGEIKGIFIADSDLILIGKNGPSKPLTLDEIVLAARAAFGQGKNPGVAITQLSHDSTLWFFNYFGNIGQTPVGVFMANCLRSLYRLGCGATQVPLEGFWLCGRLPRVKLWIYPGPGRCLVSSDKKLMVLQGTGVSFNSKEMSWESINPRVREWVDQLVERYDEMAKYYPEFAQLKRFFRLYEVFLWAKNNMNKAEEVTGIEHLLEVYSLTSRCYTPKSFRIITRKNIAKGITCRIKSLEIKEHPISDEWEEKMRLARASNPHSSVWYLRLPSPPPDKACTSLLRMTHQLKEVGLYGRCIFLYLKRRKKIPSLRIFHDDVSYLRPTASARSLAWILKKTLNERINVQSYWEKFNHRELLPLLNSMPMANRNVRAARTPILAFISDEMSSDWMILQRVKVLSKQFNLFLLPDKGKGFWPSVEDFLGKVESLPRLNSKNFSIITQVAEPETSRHNNNLEGLRKVLGNSNLLINPTKKQFIELLYKRSTKIILMQLNVTNEVIRLNGGELSWRDILRLGKLAHLRYVILVPQGPGWGEKVLKAMQTEGAGLVSILPRKPLSYEEFVKATSFVQSEESNNLSWLWLPSVLSPNFGDHLGWGSLPQ